MAKISSIQIYNAKNAYKKQMNFPELSKKKEPVDAPESIPEEAGNQETDSKEKNEES